MDPYENYNFLSIYVYIIYIYIRSIGHVKEHRSRYIPILRSGKRNDAFMDVKRKD